MIHRFFRCFIAASFIQVCTLPAIGDEPLPVPEGPALKEALRLAHEVFGKAYENAKTAADKEALGQKLFATARASADKTHRYALLDVARQLATEAGDGVTAFNAIDEMDRMFVVDALRLKGSVLYSFSNRAKTPDEHKSVAVESLKLLDQAITADRYDVAAPLAKIATTAASKSRDRELEQIAEGHPAQVDELANEYAEAKDAMAVLETDPTNAAANLTTGRFRCFIKGDWGVGLPMLALGSDAALRDLAAKELVGATDPNQQVALGDGWWDLAESSGHDVKAAMRRRACHWYGQAAPRLTGLVKEKVAVRLGAGGVPKSLDYDLPLTVKLPLPGRVGMQFRLIHPGTFVMGSPPTEAHRDSNEHQHAVTLTKPFYMGVTEVNQAQWQKVMGNKPSKHEGLVSLPVEYVSWHDAKKFLAKLNALPIGRQYHFRLPTEAEWEYASRADTDTAFCSGDDAGRLDEYAWFMPKSGRQTHPVGQKKPNAWGLYDMHGNVWEWCEDWFGDYDVHPQVDPTGPTTGSERTMRGGCFINSPEDGKLRSASRKSGGPDGRYWLIGFRVVCEPVTP